MRNKFECVAEFVYWQGRNVAWILAVVLAALLGVLWWRADVTTTTRTTAEEARVATIEQRVLKLEQATPPTCVQVHPEKFQIDIYPTPNLGKHKIVSPP